MKFLIYLIAIISLVSCHSTTGTPVQFKYKTNLPKADYKLDSARIMKKLTYMLSENISPFKPAKQFDSDTRLFLDSIIYGPDKNEMVILVISKNNNSKLAQQPNYKTNFHYNGNYLYCKRSMNDIKISNYSSFNLNYWETYND